MVIGTVSAIYWRGHRRDWQAQWLRARTTAELSWYLPMLAPLLDFSSAGGRSANWYLRVFDPGQHLRGADDVAALCADNEPLARELLVDAWSDPEFVSSYAQWTIDILERAAPLPLPHREQAPCAAASRAPREQRSVRADGARRAAAPRRAHALAVAGNDFFPGARRLIARRARAIRSLPARHHLRTPGGRSAGRDRRAFARRSTRASPPATSHALKAAIEAAIALILEEHQDWHLLVRPHNLPLA